MDVITEVNIVHLAQTLDFRIKGKSYLKILLEYLDKVSKAKGCQGVYYGTDIEEPKVFIYYTLWNCTTDHAVFRASPARYNHFGSLIEESDQWHRERLKPLFNPHQRPRSITVKFNPTADPQAILSGLAELAVFYFRRSIDIQSSKIQRGITGMTFGMEKVGALEVLHGWCGNLVLSPAVAFPLETKVLVMMMECSSKDHRLMKCFDDSRIFTLCSDGLKDFDDVLWLTVYRTELQKVDAALEVEEDRHLLEDDGEESDDGEDVPF